MLAIAVVGNVRLQQTGTIGLVHALAQSYRANAIIVAQRSMSRQCFYPPEEEREKV